jgi:hypothetical protein
MNGHDEQAIANAAAVRLIRWAEGQLHIAANAVSVDDAIYLASTCPVLAHHFSEMDRLRRQLYLRGLNFKTYVLPAAMSIIRSENPPEEVAVKIEEMLRKAISAYSSAAAASLRDEERVTSIAEFLIQNHADLADYSQEDIETSYQFARSFVSNARRKSTPPTDFSALDRELDALIC